ncbi:MAG: hypothetical protein DLM55_03585 [Acidimicrobiales bacterium]|nr:MAG: hypothetical protein DLM55_03585 [Acidimicrobiales bacterium]
MAQIVVLGGGVSGLSSAVRLLEHGHSVEVLAREVTPHTTSDTAAAIWAPYRVELGDLIAHWSMASFRQFQQLAADENSGVVMREGTFGFVSSAPPDWTNGIPEARLANEQERPVGCGSGLIARVPAIEMNRYMPWLLARVKALGAFVTRTEVTSFDEICRSTDAIVNATGLGARGLANDTDLYPVRGRIVLVEQIGLERFLDIEAGDWPIGIFPRRDDIVLTGAYEINETSLKVPDGMDEGIVERCVAFEPRLAQARRLGAMSGLRPARDAVRLELDQTTDKMPVVHNYGHGGSGVTLSWGCADDVVDLIDKACGMTAEAEIPKTKLA